MYEISPKLSFIVELTKNKIFKIITYISIILNKYYIYNYILKPNFAVKALNFEHIRK